MRLFSGPRRIVVLLTIAALLGVGGITLGARQPAAARVTAVFTDASPLVPGFTVRSHGVKVGEVESIDLRGGAAWVRMRIDDSAALPLHSDATAKIRPVSLLGERYIEFNRGSAGAPLAAQDTPIPVQRTASAVDLSDVLNTVDKPTGTALAALITTLGEGERNRGKDISAALAELAPSLRRTDDLVALLNQQNDVLGGLIDRAAPVSQALASDQGRDLDRLLVATDLLLRTTAANQAALDAGLQRLPRTLHDARQTLSRLTEVAEHGADTLGRLRPFTVALPRVTDELRGFADAADPALASVDPVLSHGQELIDEAAPLVRTLRPAGADLRSVTASARPIVADLTANLTNVLEFFRNWSLTTNGFDGVSNYFRGMVIADPTVATGLVPGGSPKFVPSPGPIDEAGPVVPPNPLLVPGEGTGEPDNVTGLKPAQEHDMVSQLLGGG
jgi:phospholipid/cholesterol/gamma-HCH transport system substrate-binding protein